MFNSLLRCSVRRADEMGHHDFSMIIVLTFACSVSYVGRFCCGVHMPYEFAVRAGNSGKSERNFRVKPFRNRNALLH
jgi:hypothetical protein